MQWTVRVDGLDELAATLRAMPARVSHTLLREALLEIGEPIRSMIARLARRSNDGRHFADDVRMAPIRRSGTDPIGEVKVGIGTGRGFFYDWFLEFGTPEMRAYPMYRPALDANGPRGVTAMGNILWRELAGRGIQRPVIAAPGPVPFLGRVA